MVDRRISALATAGSVLSTDVIPVVTSGSTKKASLAVIIATLRGVANGIAALDAGAKVPIAQLPAGTASGLATLDASSDVPLSQISSLVFGYNVRESAYGATGLGVVSDRVAIQAAIAACSAAGGGTVFVPPGTYLLDLVNHPDSASYKTGLTLPSNVWLRGAGRGATVLKLANAQPGQSDIFAAVVMNATLAGGSSGQRVSDLTIDGNNVNQTKCHHGIALVRSRRVTVENVACKNLRGTAAAGSNENFFFEVELSSDISFSDCIAFTDAGSSSSGFSANSSTGIRYVNCVSTGQTVAHGFTCNTCTSVTYTGCWAYLNVGAGFNCEVSNAIQYENCVGGGVGSTGPSYPFTSAQSLGNANGFIVNASTAVYFSNCVAESQAAGTGLFVTTASTGKWQGGAIRANLIGASLQDTCNVTFVINDVQFITNGSDIYNTALGGAHGNKNGLALPPTVPGSTVALTNPYPFAVDVYLVGGTITNVALGSFSTNYTHGMFRLGPAGTVTLTYSVAPTWGWRATN